MMHSVAKNLLILEASYASHTNMILSEIVQSIGFDLSAAQRFAINPAAKWVGHYERLIQEATLILHPAALEEVRKLAVHLSKHWMTHKEIADELGVYPLMVGPYLAKSRKSSMEELLAKYTCRRRNLLAS